MTEVTLQMRVDAAQSWLESIVKTRRPEAEHMTVEVLVGQIETIMRNVEIARLLLTADAWPQDLEWGAIEPSLMELPLEGEPTREDYARLRACLITLAALCPPQIMNRYRELLRERGITTRKGNHDHDGATRGHP